MTDVGESGFEVALGGSEAFSVLMAKMTIEESKSDLHSEKEGRDDFETNLDITYRGSSLMGEQDEEESEAEFEFEDEDEEGSNREISQSLSLNSSADEKDPFHPDLMVGLLPEGQEAMWMEDEVSTVASVYVGKKKNRFSFRHLKKEIQTEKIHIRKTKVTKTVILLPQQNEVHEQTLVDVSVQDEARQLLDQAVKADGISTSSNTVIPSNESREMAATGSVADDSVSTLGLQTDTFEYQLDNAPSQAHSQVTSYHNMDLMSISSLNEILDGPEEAIETTLSPRQMMPEIHIPTNKTPQAASAQSQSTMYRSPVAKAKSDHGQKQIKKNKKWGLLGKLRLGGKHGKSKEHDVDGKLTMPSIDEIEEEENLREVPLQQLQALEEITVKVPVDPVEETTFDVPAIVQARSSASESKSKESKASRNGTLVKQNASQETSSVASSVSSSSSDSNVSSVSSQPSEMMTSRSAESIYRLDTVKSDWDQSINFRRNPKAPAVKRMETKTTQIDDGADEEKVDEVDPIIVAPSHSICVTPDSAPANSNVQRQTTLHDCDQEVLVSAERTKMLQKSIANLSGEESTQSTSSQSHIVPTPTSKMGTSVDTCGTRATKDIRSTLGNAGVETIAESDVPCVPSQSNAVQTPTSKMGTSVDTCGTRATKDIRSTLGNAGVETIAESDGPSVSMSEEQSVRSQSVISVRSQSVRSQSVQSHSVSSQSGQSSRASGSSRSARSSGSKTSETTTSDINEYLHSDPDGSKDEATVAPTIASRQQSSRANSRQGHRFHSGNRSEKTQSVFAPPIAALFRDSDESTRGEKDSLIDFVISPRRANIVTPGGSKPYVTSHREDEQPKAMLPTLQAISEIPNDLAGHQEEDPKLKKRFPGIFGNRKSKAQPQTKSFCEDEASHFSMPPSTTSKDGKEGASTSNLNKVITEAINKAEEANLEVMTAPFPHKRHRHRKLPGETRPVPNDLVDAIRMQSGRERERTTARAPKEFVGDAPGVSFSIDTENESTANQEPARMDPTDESFAGIRVLAPTPRHRPKHSVDDHAGDKPEAESDDATTIQGDGKQELKYDQRNITERLYGPIESKESFIGNHAKVEVNKGVYIGDLLGSQSDAREEPKTAANADEHSEDVVEGKENENLLAIASPKVSAAPKCARRSLFGIRRNVLSAKH